MDKSYSHENRKANDNCLSFLDSEPQMMSEGASRTNRKANDNCLFQNLINFTKKLFTTINIKFLPI